MAARRLHGLASLPTEGGVFNKTGRARSASLGVGNSGRATEGRYPGSFWGTPSQSAQLLEQREERSALHAVLQRERAWQHQFMQQAHYRHMLLSQSTQLGFHSRSGSFSNNAAVSAAAGPPASAPLPQRFPSSTASVVFQPISVAAVYASSSSSSSSSSTVSATSSASAMAGTPTVGTPTANPSPVTAAGIGAARLAMSAPASNDDGEEDSESESESGRRNSRDSSRTSVASTPSTIKPSASRATATVVEEQLDGKGRGMGKGKGKSLSHSGHANGEANQMSSLSGEAAAGVSSVTTTQLGVVTSVMMPQQLASHASSWTS